MLFTNLYTHSLHTKLTATKNLHFFFNLFLFKRGSCLRCWCCYHFSCCCCYKFLFRSCSPGTGLLTRLHILSGASDFRRLQFNYFAHIFGEYPSVSIATCAKTEETKRNYSVKPLNRVRCIALQRSWIFIRARSHVFRQFYAHNEEDKEAEEDEKMITNEHTKRIKLIWSRFFYAQRLKLRWFDLAPVRISMQTQETGSLYTAFQPKFIFFSSLQIKRLFITVE